MRIFGFHLHRDPDPWRAAPPWAVELRQLLLRVLDETDEIEDTLSAAQRVEIALGAPTDKTKEPSPWPS